VDEDTDAFNQIMAAFGMPKSNDQEKAERKQAIANATRNAIEVPLKVMELSLESMEVMEAMAETGNPNSVSDVGVGALCARTAVEGAFLNVKINAAGFEDKEFLDIVLFKANQILENARIKEKEILELVNSKI